MRVTVWEAEFTDQDSGAMLLPQFVLLSKK